MGALVAHALGSLALGVVAVFTLGARRIADQLGFESQTLAQRTRGAVEGGGGGGFDLGIVRGEGAIGMLHRQPLGRIGDAGECGGMAGGHCLGVWEQSLRT